MSRARDAGSTALLSHVPRGTRQATGAARRRSQTVERRGAPAVPPHEDHEATRRRSTATRRRPTPPRRAGRSSSRPAHRRRRCPISRSSSSCAAPTPPARVVQLTDVSIGDLFLPFSHEIYHGERIGLIGPNGTGKTHLLNALAGNATANGEADGSHQVRAAHVGRDVHAGQRPPRVPAAARASTSSATAATTSSWR